MPQFQFRVRGTFYATDIQDATDEMMKRVELKGIEDQRFAHIDSINFRQVRKRRRRVLPPKEGAS